jgi:hypothetical protein
VFDKVIFSHMRTQSRKRSFMFLKEYTITKLYERRALRHANLVLTKSNKDRLFTAWRTIWYQEKRKRCIAAVTKQYELEVEEHKKSRVG